MGELALLSWLQCAAAASCHLLVWCCLCAAQEVAQSAAPSSPAARPAAAVVPGPGVASADVPPVAAPAGSPVVVGPTASATPSAGVAQPPSRVEEKRPAVYYLPDAQGKLQPVLDFQYEDFADLYRLKNQLGRRDQPPRYSVQRMLARGEAGPQYAELTVHFQILVRDDDWVRVPLRLDQGVLRSEVQYRGPGEQFVQFEAGGDGYVCWIRGKAGTLHELTLAMLAPLETVADETRLSLFVPRATSSELKLTVPQNGVVAKVSDDATLLAPVEQEKENTKITELTAIGLSCDFQLAWRKGTPNAVEPPAVLESVASILARFDGRSVTSEATLTVRSFGTAFDRFQVRLPPEAELSPGTGGSSGYTVVAVGADKLPAGQSRLVEVRFAKKTLGPVDLRLRCQRAFDPAVSQGWCELGGFEVLGAVRQWGSIALAAGSDWQVLWGTTGEPRQVDQVPESLRHDDVAACFEYAAQPFSLSARITPRKTRISVAPEYVILVDRDQVRLEGKLAYTVRGAKVAALQVALPGWELGEVGPDELVAVDGVAVDHAGMATIPLVQPSSGEIALKISARRTIAGGAASLALPLPQPQGNSTSPAVVAVVPADNVEILPNTVAMEGLIRQRTEPPMKLPERQQESLFYRGAGGPAVFAADLRFHSQRISVEAASEVDLGEHTVAVEQRLAYTVAYEPVDHLTIDVPRRLTESEHIKVLFEGKLLAPVAESSRRSDKSAPTVPLRLNLPRPRIGPCEIVVQYSEPLTTVANGLAAAVAISLPMPNDAEVVGNKVYVRTGANVQASLHQGPWTTPENKAGRSGTRSGLLLTTAGRVGELVLDLRREATADADVTLVDRAWVQSWLSTSIRQDRAVFQLVTNRKELQVVFPAGAAMQQAAVTLNGQQVECRALSGDRWVVPLGGDGERNRYVLELRYHFPDAGPSRGLLTLEFPRFADDVWMRRIYWQLVLPPNEHVMLGPEGLTGECIWGWRGYFWGRRPLLDQAQLEEWAGVTPQAPLPEGCSVYLFSALGNLERLELRTAGRSWIVLWASGLALCIGLLLIYVPVSRHPAVLFCLALAILIPGAIAPEPTLLFAQAASLGIALTLLTGLLDRGAVRRRDAVPGTEASHVSPEPGSVRTPHRAPAVGNPSSTQTMQAIPPPDTRNTET